MKKTLLEISEDLLALGALLDECPEEPSPEALAELERWFAELGEARDQKLDNYCALIREHELLAVARRAEIDRLQKHVNAHDSIVRRLKDRLKLFLEAQRLSRIQTKRFPIAVVGNGGLAPLQIDVPAEKLPPEFQAREVKPDCAAIRAALAAGVSVEGARLGPRGTHLRIG